MIFQKLWKEISECKRCAELFDPNPWCFPPDKEWDTGVKGFHGTGLVKLKDRSFRVIFIAYRPSTTRRDPQTGLPTEKRPRMSLRLFYEMLNEYNLQNAHLTDLTKCRRPGKKILVKEAKNCMRFLKQEINLVKPDIIVAVGNDTHRITPFIQAWFRINKPFRRIRHYAFRAKKGESVDEAYGEFKKGYKKDFEGLLKKKIPEDLKWTAFRLKSKE